MAEQTLPQLPDAETQRIGAIELLLDQFDQLPEMAIGEEIELPLGGMVGGEYEPLPSAEDRMSFVNSILENLESVKPSWVVRDDEASATIAFPKQEQGSLITFLVTKPKDPETNNVYADITRFAVYNDLQDTIHTSVQFQEPSEAMLTLRTVAALGLSVVFNTGAVIGAALANRPKKSK